VLVCWSSRTDKQRILLICAVILFLNFFHDADRQLITYIKVIKQHQGFCRNLLASGIFIALVREGDILMSNSLPYGYYYGSEADQYTFYRLPKALFTNDRYKTLSDGAKILYGLMLDRMGLSTKNEWLDDQNRVYIIFTLENVQEQMNCKHEKAVKLLAELDTNKGVGLIERVKRGQGKPSIIYVGKFFDTSEVKTSENQKSGTPDSQKSRLPKNRSQEFRKSETNKNDINNTDLSDIEFNNTEAENTHSIPTPSHDPPHKEADVTNKEGTEGNSINYFKKYGELIRENIEYQLLIKRFHLDRERIDEIVTLMIETVCTSLKTVRIAGDDFPAEVVKSKFLKITGTHIEFILDCLKKNRSEIRNIKQYLLAVIFNSSSTIDSYYSALFSHDMASN